jgi:hypothetical protein
MQNNRSSPRPRLEFFIERGLRVGFEELWPECEQYLRTVLQRLKAEVLSRLPRKIQQAEQKVSTLERHRAYVLEKLNETKAALLEGWSPFYYWLTLVFWGAVTLGDAGVFPLIYQDAFGLPWKVGLAFAAVFPAVSLIIAKGSFYGDLSEWGKRRFRKIVHGVVLISLVCFSIFFILTRALMLAMGRQSLSLSGPTGGPDWATIAQVVSMTSLWLLGLSIAIALSLMHSKYRNPREQVAKLEKELPQVEGELQVATEAYTELEVRYQTVHAEVEEQVLEAKYQLYTEIEKRKEELRMNLQKELYPYLFDPPSPAPAAGNGKVRQGLKTLSALGLLVLSSWAAPAQSQEVFLIQDLSRAAVEPDFQHFGRLVLALPGGASIRLFGSDGVQYVQGAIEDTYPMQQQRQRQTLIGQGRAFYQKIQAEPVPVRDYATCLADILPRLERNALLILQGKPLYRLDPIDWEGRIPGLSWAFHSASPFGESALNPSSSPFRAALVFAAGDLLGPNHRAAMQRFWSLLLARLNGDLVLFTTDFEAVIALVARHEDGSSLPRPDLTQISEAERRAPLKLEGAPRLGVANTP